jgi:hypothetical protein
VEMIPYDWWHGMTCRRHLSSVRFPGSVDLADYPNGKRKPNGSGTSKQAERAASL